MDQGSVQALENLPVSISQQPLTVEKLFNIQTNQGLALSMKMKHSNKLTFIGKNKTTHYSILSIKKRGETGKYRILHNPDQVMRLVQFKILKEILEKIQVPDYIHAFEKGRNIPDMAQLHVNKKVVVSVDLKDYFTSIKQYHLEQLFNSVGITDKAARTLSELCTYKSFVPQGALTSPKISNLVTAMTFGPIIKDYCDSKGLTLSIYADDITISSDNMFSTTGDDTVTSLITYLGETVGRFGFRVNSKKTKVMKYYQRQYVCGAVVNSKVNLQKSERHKLRAIVHNCEKNGIDVEAAKNNMSRDNFISVINGRLNWFNQLNPEAGTRVIIQFKKIYEVDKKIAINSQVGRVENQCSLDDKQVEVTLPQPVGSLQPA